MSDTDLQKIAADLDMLEYQYSKKRNKALLKGAIQGLLLPLTIWLLIWIISINSVILTTLFSFFMIGLSFMILKSTKLQKKTNFVLSVLIVAIAICITIFSDGSLWPDQFQWNIWWWGWITIHIILEYSSNRLEFRTEYYTLKKEYYTLQTKLLRLQLP